MITNAFLNLLWYVLLVATSPLRILADATAPAGITSVLSTVSGYASMFVDSGILQNTTLVTIIAILSFSILFETGYLSYKIIYWIIKKIPFIS